MGVVVEILLIGCVEPVIGDADVEAARLISGREVKLLRVTVVREPYRAPSCEREAFVGYTQCGLYGYVTEILTTPDGLVWESGGESVFVFSLRFCSVSLAIVASTVS